MTKEDQKLVDNVEATETSKSDASKSTENNKEISEKEEPLKSVDGKEEINGKLTEKADSNHKASESSNKIQNGETKLNICQESLAAEELEAKERTEEEDQAKFSFICQNIKILMKEIRDAKLNKTDTMAAEVEENRIKILMKMMALRKLNRIQKTRVKMIREGTLERRQQVDGVTLQLQNLLYEVSHLKKEVRRCMEFHSADQDIDLIPVEQFYLEAPETISRPDITVGNSHEQRLAQLHWELEQRRGQSELYDKLTEQKMEMGSIISEQETKLASLAPKINSIIESTLPLQAEMNVKLDMKKEQQQTSQYLPPPLYVLWVQSTAYAEASSTKMTSEIRGDIEAAKKMLATEEDLKSDISDSENELDITEDPETQKSRNRKESKKREAEIIVECTGSKQFSLHPLHVHVTIDTKNENSIAVDFYYLQQLNIVTTKCHVNFSNKNTSNFSNILSDENILDELYLGDDGKKSPNPANKYQLFELTSDEMNNIGKPYKWAQTLCGLKFVEQECCDGENESEAVKPVWQMSAEFMNKIIQMIRRRLKARLALHEQLTALETAKSLSEIPVPVETIKQHFPTKINSELRSWKPITWTDYELTPHTSPLIKSKIVTSNFLTFKAIFERKSATLEALVAISPDYPFSMPVFCLSINWITLQSSLTHPNIKAMEYEVNLTSGEMSEKDEKLKILSLQLYKLAMCLDIYTEATCAQVDHFSNEAKFHKEKIFFRPARGPERQLPFKYLPKLSVFSQR